MDTQTVIYTKNKKEKQYIIDVQYIYNIIVALNNIPKL